MVIWKSLMSLENVMQTRIITNPSITSFKTKSSFCSSMIHLLSASVKQFGDFSWRTHKMSFFSRMLNWYVAWQNCTRGRGVLTTMFYHVHFNTCWKLMVVGTLVLSYLLSYMSDRIMERYQYFYNKWRIYKYEIYHRQQTFINLY